MKKPIHFPNQKIYGIRVVIEYPEIGGSRNLLYAGFGRDCSNCPDRNLNQRHVGNCAARIDNQPRRDINETDLTKVIPRCQYIGDVQNAVTDLEMNRPGKNSEILVEVLDPTSKNKAEISYLAPNIDSARRLYKHLQERGLASTH